MVKTHFWIRALCLAAIGISGYQTWKHFQPVAETPAFCDISAYASCTAVTQSAYGYIYGIPVAIIGIIAFSAMLALTFFEPTNRRNTIIITGSVGGLLFSSYLTYAEFFILRTICPLCLIIFFIILSIAILSIATWWSVFDSSGREAAERSKNELSRKLHPDAGAALLARRYHSSNDRSSPDGANPLTFGKQSTESLALKGGTGDYEEFSTEPKNEKIDNQMNIHKD